MNQKFENTVIGENVTIGSNTVIHENVIVTDDDIVMENKLFRLVVGKDAIAKSLILKSTGEELLAAEEKIALFSSTQERPFNNEVKLAHPNKRTTYQANSLTKDGDRLIVGFEIIPYHAAVRVRIEDSYITFTLEDFICKPTDYEGLCMTPPPVSEFRVLQLAVRNRTHFGEWLNVSFDDKAAVNVLAAMPETLVDSERRVGCRILYASAERGIRLKSVTAALIVSKTDSLLDCIDRLEHDYHLPLGVESRRSEMINRSVYWSAEVNPQNVDEHIAFAKKGGFRLMLLYVSSIFKNGGYSFNGDYTYLDSYPNGEDDVRYVLGKIKAAGITPGLHILQTHIGMQSQYVAPKADRRLHLTRHFTLAKPLAAVDDGCDIYVDESPEGTVMADRVRILKFGTELISYEGYTTEYPYHFTGCKRGDHNTDIVAHPLGEIGGILDVSEFGATSVYLDQNSDLQDEIADKIAAVYRLGFEFFYFDGSEGTNEPFAYYVPLAQYRVWKKATAASNNAAPLFCEGAAKAHFSWHFLSGGNAFDVFAPDIFKAKIDEFPLEEAPRMRCDFTRLNFGWWAYFAPGTQADMYEYGTSRAAAFDCPATVQANLSRLRSHPRTDDILETMRRWEDVREKHWLTDEQKDLLKQPTVEYHLYINESGEYELIHWSRIENAGQDKELRAFAFTRGGENYVAYWYASADGKLSLPLNQSDFQIIENADIIEENGMSVVPLGKRYYLKSALPAEVLADAFRKAIVEKQ